MEIQSFILCKTITQVPQTGEYDGHMIGVYTFYSLDGTFPLEFGSAFLMVLRRETKGPQQAITLRFNLINSDGLTVGEPRNVRANAVFPAGLRFVKLLGRLPFSFPAPGDFRLDITADEETIPFTFQYNIEITK